MNSKNGRKNNPKNSPKIKYLVGFLMVVLALTVVIMGNLPLLDDEKTVSKIMEKSVDNDLLKGYDAGFNLGQSLSNITVTMDMKTEDGFAVNGMPSKLQITEKTIKAIADAGFSFIRCITDFGQNHSSAWDDNAFVDEFIKNNADDFSFTIDKRWLDLLEKIISWCEKYNLKFILCLSNTMALKNAYFYCFEEGGTVYKGTLIYWAQPNETFAPYARLYMQKVWSQIASAFCNVDSECLSYEIVNEPLNRAYYYSAGLTGTNIWDDWTGTEEALKYLQEYEQIAISAIRAIDKEKLIIVPTYAHNLESDALNSALEIAKTDSKAVVGFHWYYPQDICGNNVSILDATFSDQDKVSVKNLRNLDELLSEDAIFICTEGAVEVDTKFVPLKTQNAWLQYIREEFINKRKIPFSLFDNGSLYDGSVVQHTDVNRIQSNQSYGFLDRKQNTWYNVKNILVFTGKSLLSRSQQ